MILARLRALCWWLIALLAMQAQEFGGLCVGDKDRVAQAA
jgi:hypothetical protein